MKTLMLFDSKGNLIAHVEGVITVEFDYEKEIVHAITKKFTYTLPLTDDNKVSFREPAVITKEDLK